MLVRRTAHTTISSVLAADRAAAWWQQSRRRTLIPAVCTALLITSLALLAAALSSRHRQRHFGLAGSMQGGAVLRGGRTLYILRANSNHSNVQTIFQAMQQDLGIQRVFLALDDTSLPLGWPYGPGIRMTARRPAEGRGSLMGAPHVLLFNRSEAEAVMGATLGDPAGMLYWE